MSIDWDMSICNAVGLPRRDALYTILYDGFGVQRKLDWTLRYSLTVGVNVFAGKAFRMKFLRCVLKNTGIFRHRQRKVMAKTTERRKEIMEIQMLKISMEENIFSTLRWLGQENKVGFLVLFIRYRTFIERNCKNESQKCTRK